MQGLESKERLLVKTMRCYRTYLKAHNMAYDQAQFDKLAGQGNSVSYLISGDQV